MTACGIGFSALPFCAGIGRGEACCSVECAMSDRVVERGGVSALWLEDGAADVECSRSVVRPPARPSVGCAAPLDCWVET